VSINNILIFICEVQHTIKETTYDMIFVCVIMHGRWRHLSDSKQLSKVFRNGSNRRERERVEGVNRSKSYLMMTI
jgi:hypothetical protein